MKQIVKEQKFPVFFCYFAALYTLRVEMIVSLLASALPRIQTHAADWRVGKCTKGSLVGEFPRLSPGELVVWCEKVEGRKIVGHAADSNYRVEELNPLFSSYCVASVVRRFSIIGSGRWQTGPQ